MHVEHVHPFLAVKRCACGATHRKGCVWPANHRCRRVPKSYADCLVVGRVVPLSFAQSSDQRCSTIADRDVRRHAVIRQTVTSFPLIDHLCDRVRIELELQSVCPVLHAGELRRDAIEHASKD